MTNFTGLRPIEEREDATEPDGSRSPERWTGPLWTELGKVWTIPIMDELGLREPARFNELKRRIDGISAAGLAERLSGLERQGIIHRLVHPMTPPRVEYSLTQKGRELHAILSELVEWMRRWDGGETSTGGSEQETEANGSAA